MRYILTVSYNISFCGQVNLLVPAIMSRHYVNKLWWNAKGVLA